MFRPGPISDAWSLGGLLFATVEGRPPFDQGTAIATLTSVVKDPVPPHPHSGRLGAVVSGLLVKTPALRMRIDRALMIMRRSPTTRPGRTSLRCTAFHGRIRAAQPDRRPRSGQVVQPGQPARGHRPQARDTQQGSAGTADPPRSADRRPRRAPVQRARHSAPGTRHRMRHRAQRSRGPHPPPGRSSPAGRPHRPRRAAHPAPAHPARPIGSTRSPSPSAQRQPAMPPPFPQLPTSASEGSGFLPARRDQSGRRLHYPPGAALPWVAGQGTSGPGQPVRHRPTSTQPTRSRAGASLGIRWRRSGRTSGGQLGRPFASGPAADPLPPPPWAQSDSATLAPLPAPQRTRRSRTIGRRHHRGRDRSGDRLLRCPDHR